MQDLYGGALPSEHTNLNERVQNYNVHIGDDPDYTKNPQCAGGPFMRTDDPNSYSTLSNTIPDTQMWNYGAEIWCNLEG